jgi:hypothetical protein
MKMILKIFLVFLFFFSFFSFQPGSSYAYWRGHVWVGVGWPGPYYYGYPYYPYPYYDPYYYPSSYVTESAGFQPVVINGATYYLNNGVYYTYGQYGYQQVPMPPGTPGVAEPSGASITVAGENDTVTVNIPDNKGGYAPVVLKKSGKGWVGPQGEYYPEFPKVSQLQTMYGK